MRSWSTGIFGFFFSRAVVAIVSFAIILLLILLPFFKNQLLQMVESQGQTFANSTIAATTSNLYTESYGDVIEYVSKVLKDTDNILFVVITKNAGDDIVISKGAWRQASNLFKTEHIRFGQKQHSLYFGLNPVTNNSCFIYQQSIDIGGASWGVLTVGMSDQQYEYIKNRYTLIVGVISALLVALLLFLFFRSSKKIRVEMSGLSETASQLQTGNLAARASEEGIGEIGALSKAINTMAIHLQQQTQSTKQLAQIVEQTDDAFILFDSSLSIIFANDAAATVTGYQATNLIGMTIVEFTGALGLDLTQILRDLDWIKSNKQSLPTRDAIITRSDQVLLDVEMRLESIAADQNADKSNILEQYQGKNFLLVMSNITTRKLLEKELHQLAFYDKLTDLPNRRMFTDHLRNVIKQSKRNKRRFALFFMDLDNFKFINDTLGHETGDKFLVQIVKKLKEIFSQNDMIARLGGDEFTILVEGFKDTDSIDAIAKLAEKLVLELATQHTHMAGRSLSVSTSLGIAQYPEDGADTATLLRNADIAMYSAKKSGKNRYAFFSEEMNEALRYRIEIENDLKYALEVGGQVSFYYQPIINLANNELVGAEALVRWKHPLKGFIPPAEFIPIAETSNLIGFLSDHLIHTAFKQAQAWSKLALIPYISINVSGRQFEKRNFVDGLVNTLNLYQVSASNIQLEFTESIMLDSTRETIAKFEALKTMGFKIAIDDFGTGYSSLAYIHKLPIDVIKIDMSFVNGMIKNKKMNSIVAAITKLSNVLEIKTIAEGIELVEHAEILKKLQCDYGQGYFYDKALPIEEFEQKYLLPVDV